MDTYEVTIREKKRKWFKVIQSEKKIGFTFKISTYLLLEEYAGIGPLDWIEKRDDKTIIKIMYCACQLWHLERKLFLDFTEKDVVYWMEHFMTRAQYSELVNLWWKTSIGGQSIEEMIPKIISDVKKKLHGEKSEIVQ